MFFFFQYPPLFVEYLCFKSVLTMCKHKANGAIEMNGAVLATTTTAVSVVIF